MDETLRRSAAHVLVASVCAPVLDDASLHHVRRRAAAARRGERHGDRRRRPVAAVCGGRRISSSRPATSRRFQLRRRRSRSPSPRPRAIASTGWCRSARRSASTGWCSCRPSARSSAGTTSARRANSTGCGGSPSRRPCSRGGCGCPRSAGRRQPPTSWCLLSPPNRADGRSHPVTAPWPSVRKAGGRPPSWSWPTIGVARRHRPARGDRRRRRGDPPHLGGILADPRNLGGDRAGLPTSESRPDRGPT